jgi:hypothetical protein
MENKMRVFVGMIKGTSMFLMGEPVDNLGDLQLKYAVRVFEMPLEGGRIGYQFHPDPYFTSDALAHVDLSEFLMWRIESNEDDKMVKEYQNFLTQLRMQKSGLVSGVKPILKDVTK